MSKTKLNEKILHGIKEESKGDSIMEKFLVELVFEEASHTGIWRWKENYKQKIEHFSKDWGVRNEN